ncbi:MAG: hypothetical protein PHY24_08185, partial [Candidatus Cloacimonetes bacterium]|nr:hypothetical protein [Candidatus Cloacimonadota bacterium]
MMNSTAMVGSSISMPVRGTRFSRQEMVSIAGKKYYIDYYSDKHIVQYITDIKSNVLSKGTAYSDINSGL